MTVASPAPRDVKPRRDRALGLVDAQPVQRHLVVGAVDRRPLADVGGPIVPTVGRLHRADDRQAERLGEVPVALVLARHRHDGAGAVAHQDVVRDEDGERLAVDRVGGGGAHEHAGLLALGGLAVELALARRRGAVRLHRLLGRGGARGPARVGALGPGVGQELVDHRVLGRQHHVRGTEQRVGARGEHRDGTDLGGEAHLGALAAADPVPLHQLDRLRPVEPVEVGDQPIGVGGDAHHPLLHRTPEHGEVPALGPAVGGDLLVGQHRAQPRAPVHRHLLEVREAVHVDHRGDGPPRRARPTARRTGWCREPARGRRRRARPAARRWAGRGPGRGRTSCRRSAGRSTGSSGSRSGRSWRWPAAGRGRARSAGAAWR